MTTYNLDSIGPFFYSFLQDNTSIDWKNTMRVTPQEEEALETMSHKDNHNLDERLVTSIVKAERCSSTAREEEGVGEGSSTSRSGGVQLPLDGQVKEHVPGKGEIMSAIEKTGVIVRIDDSAGFGYVGEYGSKQKYIFAFSRVPGYYGQSARRLNLKEGCRVRFQVEDDIVTSLVLL